MIHLYEKNSREKCLTLPRTTGTIMTKSKCLFAFFFYFQEFITKLYGALMCAGIIDGIHKVRFGVQEIYCAANFL